MDSRSDLSGLLGRVEAATGADRRVDAAICRQFDLPVCFEPDCLPEVYERCIARVEAGGEDSDVQSYTASLDAALALCERVLPELESWKLEPGFARIYVPDHAYSGSAKTADLALLAAMLKALIAQGEAGTAEPLSRPGRK